MLGEEKDQEFKCFDFLKGNDKEFENAMNSISSTYDNMFSDDPEYKNFAVKDNPITAKMDRMEAALYARKDQKKGPKYVKEEAKQANQSQNQLIIGQPVYGQPVEGNHQNNFYQHGLSQNNNQTPYQQYPHLQYQGPPQNYYQRPPQNNYYQGSQNNNYNQGYPQNPQQTNVNNMRNPYYNGDDSSQINYFGAWKGAK